MTAGTARVVHGNALDLPLDDATVDLIVTSPPFLNLRSYQDGGQHYAGQIGTGTRADFLEQLWAATAEMVRVLKPTGSIFVELGDSYTNKSLNQTPHRYAIGCTDRLGLIQRAEIIWSRPNGLPESVTDRVRRSHSVWFHFVKEPRYYSAVDEIREAHGPVTTGRNPNGARGVGYRLGADGLMTNGLGAHPTGVDGHLGFNPLGKLPGSVWTIPTQPLTVPAHLGVDHFAAFPMEWPRRIIRGWSPAGVCVACGEGRRPVINRGESFPRAVIGAHRNGKVTAERGDGASVNNTNGQERNAWRAAHPHSVTGYACGCPDTTAPTTPGVVVDPFGGTGTTALVAKALGREGISVDLSQDYCRLAEWRTTDPQQLAAAMQVERPDAAPEGIDSLLDLIDGGVA